MKRKIFTLILTIFVLITSFCTTASAETYTVTVKIVASFSDMNGENFVAYFKHIETGEEVKLTLTSLGQNEFASDRFTEGEYSLEKCVLERNETVEYEVVSSPQNLIISHSTYTSYTFRIAETSNSRGTGEWKPLEVQISLERYAVVIALLAIPLLIIVGVIILSILGRRNYFIKTIAQLSRHLLFASIGYVVGVFVAPSFDVPQIIPVLFCTCFPFGAMFILMLAGFYCSALTDEDIRASNEAREFRSGDTVSALATTSFIALFFLAILCGIIGVIMCPIVLIKDIVTIIKSRKYNYKAW